MTLSSASTLAEVQAAYEDNASYDLNNSTTECRAFIQAARILIHRTLDQHSHGSESMSESVARLQNALDKAIGWLSTHDDDYVSRSSGSVRFMSVEDFR